MPGNGSIEPFSYPPDSHRMRARRKEFEMH